MYVYVCFYVVIPAFIAQGLERWSSKPEVGSSILPEGMSSGWTFIFKLKIKSKVALHILKHGIVYQRATKYPNLDI